MKIHLAIILFHTAALLQGQIIEGRITAAKDQSKLPYVNVGISGKGIGTVSDEHGHFRLDISNATMTDTLRISYIGYTAYIQDVASIREQGLPQPVALTEQVFDLHEITVRPFDLVPVTLGNTFSSPAIAAGFKSDELGCEAGTIMRIKNGKTYYLNTAGFFVAQCNYDSILFRLNIYPYNKGKMGDVLHQLPIYIKVTPGMKHVRVDLTPYYISVDQDFVMALEWIQDLPDKQKGFYFCAGFLGDGVMARETSQDDFEKFGWIGLGMYCETEFVRN
jgi:hypothetical protein